MIKLVPVNNALPEDFDTLREEAESEGFLHLNRLSAEFAEAKTTFTSLLAAFIDDKLVGIGGLTPEPDDPTALRMRRLYVSSSSRRKGVATAIVNALLQQALSETSRVTVHAGNPIAAQFWESCGFQRINGKSWSHCYSPRDCFAA